MNVIQILFRKVFPRRRLSSIKIVQAERRKDFREGFDRRTDYKLTDMKNLFFCSSVQYQPLAIFVEDRRRLGIVKLENCVFVCLCAHLSISL